MSLSFQNCVITLESNHYVSIRHGHEREWYVR